MANIPNRQDSEHLPGCRPLPKSMPGKGHAPNSSNKLAILQSHGKDSNWYLRRLFLSVETDISERLRVAGLSLVSLYSWEGTGATTQD